MNRFLKIAHRGYSARFPENTMLAFEEALKTGADGFECDLRMTRDDHVVVFHDASLKRLCGVEKNMEDLSWDELKKLKVGGKEPIPLLEEVLSFQNSVIDLEIKKSKKQMCVLEKVLQALKSKKIKSEVRISSFEFSIIEALQKIESKVRCGWITSLEKSLLFPSRTLKKGFDFWAVHYSVLNSRWEKRCLQEKLPPLWIWTVDKVEDFQRVVHSPLPIEAIVSNDVNALCQFLHPLPPLTKRNLSVD